VILDRNFVPLFCALKLFSPSP